MLWVIQKGCRWKKEQGGGVGQTVRVVGLSKGCRPRAGWGRWRRNSVDERVDLWPFHKYRYKQITTTITTQQQLATTTAVSEGSRRRRATKKRAKRTRETSQQGGSREEKSKPKPKHNMNSFFIARSCSTCSKWQQHPLAKPRSLPRPASPY